MADCCQPHVEPDAALRFCPSCGRPGRAVEEITLKALLKPEALARRGESEHRFCPTPSCPIVYFGKDVTFSRMEVGEPVFQKETGPSRIVCHCLGINEDVIRAEVAERGTSASVERIRALVEAGACACEVRNPQGTCCLGNVASVVADAGCSAVAERSQAPS
jgi:Zinc binding domain